MRASGKAFTSQSPYGQHIPQLRVEKHRCVKTVVGTVGETIGFGPCATGLRPQAALTHGRKAGFQRPGQMLLHVLVNGRTLTSLPGTLSYNQGVSTCI